jgi:hypothetical protein
MKGFRGENGEKNYSLFPLLAPVDSFLPRTRAIETLWVGSRRIHHHPLSKDFL